MEATVSIKTQDITRKLLHNISGARQKVTTLLVCEEGKLNSQVQVNVGKFEDFLSVSGLLGQFNALQSAGPKTKEIFVDSSCEHQFSLIVLCSYLKMKPPVPPAGRF